MRRRPAAGAPPFLHRTPASAPSYEELSYSELLDEARRLYASLQVAWHMEVSCLEEPNWQNLEDLDLQLHRIESMFDEVGAPL